MNSFHSRYGVLGLEDQFTDWVSIVRDSPEALSIRPISLNDITSRGVLLPVSQATFLRSEPLKAIERRGGEGIITPTFQAPLYTPSISATIPVIFEAGALSASIMHIWDMCRLASWGSSSWVLATLTGPSALTELTINNIEEFVGLSLPCTATVYDSVHSESASIVSLDKANLSLTLANNLQYSYNVGAKICVAPSAIGSAGNPPRPPSCVMATRNHGVFYSMMVDKITMSLQQDSNLELKVELKSLYTTSSFHPTLISHFPAPSKLTKEIVKNWFLGVSAYASSNGDFGLPAWLGNPLTSGYQGPDWTAVLENAEIKIDNKLSFVHTLQANPFAFSNNRFPSMIVSEGSEIQGSLTFKTPLDATKMIEALDISRASANSGISLHNSYFSIDLRHCVYSPSEGTSNKDLASNKVVKFRVLNTERNGIPELKAHP